MKYALFLSLKQSCAYGKDVCYDYDLWFMVRDIAYYDIYIYIYICVCDVRYILCRKDPIRACRVSSRFSVSRSGQVKFGHASILSKAVHP